MTPVPLHNLTCVDLPILAYLNLWTGDLRCQHFEAPLSTLIVQGFGKSSLAILLRLMPVAEVST